MGVTVTVIFIVFLCYFTPIPTIFLLLLVFDLAIVVFPPRACHESKRNKEVIIRSWPWGFNSGSLAISHCSLDHDKECRRHLTGLYSIVNTTFECDSLVLKLQNELICLSWCDISDIFN